jgi:hypothetical protein
MTYGHPPALRADDKNRLGPISRSRKNRDTFHEGSYSKEGKTVYASLMQACIESKRLRIWGWTWNLYFAQKTEAQN